MLVLALIAVGVAFLQNFLMLLFGLKESAIFSSPLSFGGIFLAEFVAIWVGYFCVRKFLRDRRVLVLAGWVIAVLGAAEFVLPVSFFRTLLQHAKRERVLGGIEHVRTRIEPLASDQDRMRFALTYVLKFPKNAHYLTFPAYLGPPGNRVFGEYVTKFHPELYDEDHLFDAGTPYSFTVVFDTGNRQFDFSRENVNIDICDGKDYFMACRIIALGLRDVPAAFAAHPAPTSREPSPE